MVGRFIFNQDDAGFEMLRSTWATVAKFATVQNYVIVHPDAVVDKFNQFANIFGFCEELV
jgi:hypothetical protein